MSPPGHPNCDAPQTTKPRKSPTPATPAKTCPQCGATVAAGAPEGLCPRCVAALNLHTDTEMGGAAGAGLQPIPTPEELAAHFPQLEIIGFLGRGGMGVVYQARQKALGRLIALKLLAPERVHDPEFAERFAREAKILTQLNHPNIVTIHWRAGPTRTMTPTRSPRRLSPASHPSPTR